MYCWLTCWRTLGSLTRTSCQLNPVETFDDNETTRVSPTDIGTCLPVEEESTEICFGVVEGVEVGIGDTAGVAVAAGAVTATIMALLD